MFECVQICTVSDTLPALQRCPPVQSARRGLSGIECRPVQRVQRPGVCTCAPCLGWSALPPVPCSRSGCAGVGKGAPAGYIAAAQPRPVSPVSSDQNKKGTFFANTHFIFTKRNPSDCASLQKFQKIKKGPFPGLICAILDRKKGAL